jgi:hypothetical protein
MLIDFHLKLPNVSQYPHCREKIGSGNRFIMRLYQRSLVSSGTLLKKVFIVNDIRHRHLGTSY